MPIRTRPCSLFRKDSLVLVFTSLAMPEPPKPLVGVILILRETQLPLIYSNTDGMCVQ